MSTPAPPTAPAAMAAGNRKRPRLDLTLGAGEKDPENANGRERKRGKSMFGLLLGTLNKAKSEDTERNKSEAVRQVVYLSSDVLTNRMSLLAFVS